MKYKFRIISSVIFISILFAGLQFGISPLRQSLSTFKKQAMALKKISISSMPVDMPSDYISGNQYNIDILHYDLDIDLYPSRKLLKGEAGITGLILNNNLSAIDLNFYDNMKITKIELNGKPTGFTNTKTRLTIPLASIVSDTFNIKISYEGTPKRSGLSAFVFGEINKKSVVYNLSEPTFASTWFPCNDMPSDKALLDIRITNDSSMTSVSNGVLVGEKENGARKTYHWKTHYPISTYLVCLYSADYENFSQTYVSQDKADTMSIEYYVFPEHLENAEKDFNEHPEMIQFFSKTFGEYPFIKEKYGVAEFLWQMGAMEHQTITGIGSNFVSGRQFYTDVYVHELAHHWWGDAVGPKTWKDIWLNEGFATYSEALYYENRSGKKALQSTMMSKFQSNFTGKLAEPGDYLFSSTVYDKGAWVLHMLRWEIGDSAFFNLLSSYFEKYKYHNASTADFISLAEKISGKNLTKFFKQWLYGEGILQLGYTWNFKNQNDKYIVSIELKQLQEGYSSYSFPLEIEFETKGSGGKTRHTFFIDSREKTLQFTLDYKPSAVNLDPDNWLLASSTEMGMN